MTARIAPANPGLLAIVCGLSVMVGLLAGLNPKFAIIASLGIGFVLLVFVDLALGLALFGFFSFLEILHPSAVISVGKLGGALLAIGWLAHRLTSEDAEEDFLSVHPGISTLFGLFLGWVVLSSFWAENTQVAYNAFGRYTLNILLFFIVFTAVRDRRQATMVIAGFIAGAVAAGLYGMQANTQDVYGGRLSGAGLDPNELASALVAGIALAAGMFVNVKGKLGTRVALIGAGSFCFLATLFTGSRGGLIALGAMVLAAVLFGGRWRGRIAVAGALLTVFAAFWVVALAPQEIHDRILSSSQGEAQVEEGRTTLWHVAERMVKTHPINGVGADNFQNSSRHYLLEPGAVFRSDVIIETPQVTHNTYLQVAAELGLVGLSLLALIIFFSLRCALLAARIFERIGDRGGEALARAVLIGLVGVLVADTFISQQYNKQLWLMLGLGPAMLAFAQRSASAARASESEPA
jgi:putative inorganic carbon (hco3(-)) transporter